MQKLEFTIDLYGQLITHTVHCKSQAEAWEKAFVEVRKLTTGAEILVRCVTFKTPIPDEKIPH